MTRAALPSQPFPGVGNRLAFSSVKFDLNIWRIDLKGPGQKPGLPSRFIASTQQELYPAYSPDGSEDRLYVATIRDG